MRPPEEVRRIITRQWLEKAGQDMETSEFLLASEQSFTYPICFHAQQAAEKYLKALLTWRQIEFPKTHAIEILLELLERVDVDIFASLQDAAALTPYGVEIRYPGDQPNPDMEDAGRAVKLAWMVRDVVSKRLAELNY